MWTIFSGVKDRITNKHGCIQKRRVLDQIDLIPRYRMEYEQIRLNASNFDILLYRDMDPVSRVIKAAETATKGCGMFSHAALLVRGDLVQKLYAEDFKIQAKIDPDEVYVFESTLSGRWNDGVLNIEDKTHFGVQVRSLKEQLKCETRTIFWCPLKATWQQRLATDDSETAILNCLKKYNKVGYNYHIGDLLLALLPVGTGERWKEAYLHTDEGLMFCSELVAACLQRVGVIDKTVRAANVLPVDFLGTHPEMPCLIASIVAIHGG